MSKTVRRDFDPAAPGPLAPVEVAQLNALREKAEDSVDVSDIPEAGPTFWAGAGPNRYYRPIKQQLTLRLDSDLVAWFKSHAPTGRGYQTDINRALREYVMAKERDVR
jgi:uncharacterized protein (DUF4415 family)